MNPDPMVCCLREWTKNVHIGRLSTMSAIAPRNIPDHLLSQGRSTFTLLEAQKLLGDAPVGSVLRTLSRLHANQQIFSPARGLWVIIPPEYRSWGVVPAKRFIDPMMSVLDRTYYVALLSAAAFHGASHQAPQVFQVMCAPPLRDRAIGRIRLRFYSGRHVLSAPVEMHTVATGAIRISTAELTVIDMVSHPNQCGGYGNIATILRELSSLSGASLAMLARPRGHSMARRVGWLVEQFGDHDDLLPLHQAAEPTHGEPTLLRAGAGRRGRVDKTWGIRVNTDVQADL